MPTKVSVLLAVKNEARWLREALESLAAQTYAHIEIVIVDDGSSDDSFAIAEDFTRRDDRFRLQRSPAIGKTAAYNAAFAAATGDLFCFFAGDDALTADSVALRVEALGSEYAEKVISVCGYQVMSATRQFDGVTRLPREGTTLSLFSGGFVMFGKRYAASLFPIPEVYPSEDRLAYYLAANGGYVVRNLMRPLYLYRIHDNNTYLHSASYRDMRHRFQLDPLVIDEAIKRIEQAGDGRPAPLMARRVCAAHSARGRPVRCLLTRGVSVRTRVQYAIQSRRSLYDLYSGASSLVGRK